MSVNQIIIIFYHTNFTNYFYLYAQFFFEFSLNSSK